LWIKAFEGKVDHIGGIKEVTEAELCIIRLDPERFILIEPSSPDAMKKVGWNPDRRCNFDIMS
jgi:hypothetical protein